MKKIPTLLILVVLLFFSSCGSLSNVSPLNLLMGNNWLLSSLMGKGLETGKFSSGLPFLNFMDGGRLAGFTGCNNFAGNFSLEGSNLNLSPGAMTKKACEGVGENDFITALSQVKNFKVSKDKLTLFDGETELMSLIPQARN